MSLNPVEEKAAFDLGYHTFQNRRGLNPFPVGYPLWQKFEAGWKFALNNKAEDKSSEWLTQAEIRWKENGVI